MNRLTKRERAGALISRLSPNARVWVLTGVVTAAALALTAGPIRLMTGPPWPALLPWLLLVLLVACTEIGTVFVHFRGQTHSWSMSEVPLVIGLVFFDPLALVAAQMVGSGIALLGYRRQFSIKGAFNLAIVWLETCVMLAIYHALLDGATPIGARGFIAAFIAIGLGTWLVSLPAVPLAMSLYEGSWQKHVLRWVIVATMAATVANTSLGLVAATVLWYEPVAIGLVVVVAAILFMAYRAYGSWRQKHDSLKHLYALNAPREPDPPAVVAAAVLEHACDLLRAGVAEMMLYDADGAVVLELGLVDGEMQPESRHLNAVPGVLRQMANSSPALLPRRAKLPAWRHYLETSGLKDLMVAPLLGEDGRMGFLLVANRLDELTTFNREDLRLLETLANHVNVTLQNSRLVERLRGEANARRHEALHDALTGLPNRTQFHEAVTDALERRKTGESLAVLLMDLNHFKEINDTLGHHVGDRLLRRIGEVLVEAAAGEGMVARLGGDEFAILLPAVADGADARVRTEKLRLAASQPVELDGMRLHVEGSVGIALCPENGEDSSTLLRCADVAMYEAKRTRSGIELYTPARDRNSPGRLVMASRLREAIKETTMMVHYQPKADLRSGQVVGVEALARWHHPEHGHVSPAEFIPMAEQAGLIRPLTRFVLQSVLQQWHAWREVGIDLEIAVNLSTWSLLDVHLADDIRGLLGEYSMPPRRLRLEITETSMMADPHRSAEILTMISDMKVGLSVDDFGTGYSSLAWLKRLPVDELKIDRTFVAGMTNGEDEDSAIVRSTVELARTLGLHVVAEGVENQATWDLLRGFGCHAAQGYLLARPMVASRFQEWLTLYHEHLGDITHSVALGDDAFSS